MEAKKAKEKLGKIVTVRPEPRAHGYRWRILVPGHTIEYVKIVNDLDYPDRKWLELLDGDYVNYDYPPSGIRYILLEDVIEYDTIKILFLQDGITVMEREFYDTHPAE